MAKGELTPSVNPQTIADGLRASLGTLAYKILRENHVEIVTVSEEAIVSAMKLVFEILKQVIEPSSAVGVAALLDPASNLKGKQVGVILCGGNLDLERLPWITGK
jgi:threonine dehydratase